jgi:hypothetical protein
MYSLLLQQRDLSWNYRKIYMILFAAYLLLKPFYMFQSGLPQASDMILTFLVFLSFFTLQKDIFSQNAFILMGSVFFYYSAVVNLIWGIVLGGEFELVGNSVFYLYNLIVSVVFIDMAAKMGKPLLMKMAFYAIAFSVIIQCFLIPFFMQNHGIRTTLMFNNPNQLGYFGLLSLAILIVAASELKVPPLLFFTSILGTLILILISLSKAAMISGVFTILLFLVVKKRKSIGAVITKRYLMLFVGLLLVLFLLNANSILHSPFVQDIVGRLDSIGQQSDDSLAGRGYDRIIKHPYYIFLGAGEGLYSRFQARFEMHSTIGNILFSYGIVGLTLFAFFLYKAVSGLRLSQTYPLYAVLIFGLTHNGIRNTLLWLLLVLLYVQKTNTGGTREVDGRIVDHPTRSKSV